MIHKYIEAFLPHIDIYEGFVKKKQKINFLLDYVLYWKNITYQSLYLKCNFCFIQSSF